MKFDFGIQDIQFNQEFLPTYSIDLKFRIYRFNIYQLHPSNIFQHGHIEYFSIIDEETGKGDIAVFAVRWSKRYPTLIAERQMLVLHGDTELFGYICDALIDFLEMDKLKSQRGQSTE